VSTSASDPRTLQLTKPVLISAVETALSSPRSRKAFLDAVTQRCTLPELAGMHSAHPEMVAAQRKGRENEERRLAAEAKRHDDAWRAQKRRREDKTS